MTSRKGRGEEGCAKTLARVVMARNTVTPIAVMVLHGVHMLTAGVLLDPRPPQKNKTYLMCQARMICTYTLEGDIMVIFYLDILTVSMVISSMRRLLLANDASLTSLIASFATHYFHSNLCHDTVSSLV